MLTDSRNSRIHTLKTDNEHLRSENEMLRAANDALAREMARYKKMAGAVLGDRSDTSAVESGKRALQELDKLGDKLTEFTALINMQIERNIKRQGGTSDMSEEPETYELASRKVNNPIRKNKYTQVYRIVREDGIECYKIVALGKESLIAIIPMQTGPVQEDGLNGAFVEDLLAIARDRLQEYQRGKHSCRENAIAITKIEDAIFRLNHRTAQREKAGIEGTSQHLPEGD